MEFHGTYEINDSGPSHKTRISSVALEIWKATGYRFTCADIIPNLKEILNETAASKTTHNFPTDTRRDFGARKMKHIGPSLLEQLEKPRVIFTNRDSRVRGRFWQRPGSHVGVGSLFRRETQKHLVVPSSLYECTITSHMNPMSI